MRLRFIPEHIYFYPRRGIRSVNCHTYENYKTTVGMKIAFMTAILLKKEVFTPPRKTTKP